MTAVTLDAQVAALLTGTVVPLVIAVTSKLGASSKLKAVMNLVVSVASGVLAAFAAAGGTLPLPEILSAGVSAYLASGVTYQSLWKPSGVSGAVAVATPHLGLGSNEELLEWDRAAKEAAAGPDTTIATRVTTLKGYPTYADASGYLFVPLDAEMEA